MEHKTFTFGATLLTLHKTIFIPCIQPQKIYPPCIKLSLSSFSNPPITSHHLTTLQTMNTIVSYFCYSNHSATPPFYILQTVSLCLPSTRQFKYYIKETEQELIHRRLISVFFHLLRAFVNNQCVYFKYLMLILSLNIVHVFSGCIFLP